MLQIQGVLAMASFWDLIDILVITIVLYRIYLMLKNTRAQTLLIGLMLLFMAMFVSNRMNLHVVNWLLEKTFWGIMVAIPVVFQPELRRGLEKLGSQGDVWIRFATRIWNELFGERTNSYMEDQELREMLGEISKAVGVMSKEKVGALIVFDRDKVLETVLETGIQINADIRNELLQQIFVKNTPLHDRAVIIRDDRIVATCCDLPPTKNNNLSQDMGSRHRAAVGVTELYTGTLALVVSEETGTISVARNGDLLRYLSPADAVEIVFKWIKKGQKEVPSFIKKLRMRREESKK